MIKSITLKNFFSFKDCTINLEGDENVLVGVNASGKTNLFKAIKLLKEGITGKGFLDTVIGWGGFDEIANHSMPKDSLIELTYDLQASFLSKYGYQFEQESKVLYSLSFRKSPGSQNFSLIETLNYHKKGGAKFLLAEAMHGQGYFRELNTYDDSISSSNSYSFDPRVSIFKLVSDPDRYAAQMAFRNAVESIDLYSDFDVSEDGIMRLTFPQLNQEKLSSRGDNLCAVLNSVESQSLSAYNDIKSNLKSVNEHFRDLKVKAIGGRFSLEIEEDTLDRTVGAIHISDGTLRFLCLMAILYNPNRGGLICIDEPELGLHPDMIMNLHNAIGVAAKTSQVILATHSPILLDLVNVENIRVFEKDDTNATVVNQFSSDQFKEWKGTFLPGDLWMKGHLGGTRW